MSVAVTTTGSTVQINIQTIGCTFSFSREAGGANDATAVADVIRRAIDNEITALRQSEWAERNRRQCADRTIIALRGQVTRLKNRLAAK